MRSAIPSAKVFSSAMSTRLNFKDDEPALSTRISTRDSYQFPMESV